MLLVLFLFRRHQGIVFRPSKFPSFPGSSTVLLSSSLISSDRLTNTARLPCRHLRWKGRKTCRDRLLFVTVLLCSVSLLRTGRHGFLFFAKLGSARFESASDDPADDTDRGYFAASSAPRDLWGFSSPDHTTPDLSLMTRLEGFDLEGGNLVRLMLRAVQGGGGGRHGFR